MDAKTFTSLLAKRIDREPEDVEVVINQLANLIAENVKEGNSVTIPGFGAFESKLRGERVAAHPSTGKRILVPPKMSTIFKPSALLKQKVR